MTRGFKRTRRGIRARLDDAERALLAHVFVQVYELLDDGSVPSSDPLAAMLGIGISVDAPSDPALARLLPDAHRDDPEAAAEFRRYTEVGLRERKRSGLETARTTLGRDGPLLLDAEEAGAWVIALTDVRLVLAARMGLETDEDHDRLAEQLGAARADPDDGEQLADGLTATLMLYDFLGWLQETLVEALLEPLPD